MNALDIAAYAHWEEVSNELRSVTRGRDDLIRMLDEVANGLSDDSMSRDVAANVLRAAAAKLRAA